MREVEVIVIGGGIAGLTAALTAARLGRSVLIFTGGVPGGELLNIERIDGLPGHPDGIAGYDLCPIAQDMADAAGVAFVMDEATSLETEGEHFVVSGPTDAASARAVILATGAAIARLGVPGEAEFAGRGVSHCASCDGPLLRGKAVVVVGGGDSGMQEALTLAQHVSAVTIVERGPELTGQKAYRDAVTAEAKISVIAGHEIAAIEGTGSVEGVVLAPVDGGEARKLAVSGVFAFTGLVPALGPAEGMIEADAAGLALVDAGLRSSLRGVCAAGNCRSGSGWRAASAMGDGAAAAQTIEAFLARGIWHK